MEICLDMPPLPPATTLPNNKGWGCTFFENGETWIDYMKEHIMVVATVVATITYQMVANPPDSISESQTNRSESGTLVLALVNEDACIALLASNSIAFLFSLISVIYFILYNVLKKMIYFFYLYKLIHCV